MNPHKVALALKLAHISGDWSSVGLVIEEIEHVYGEARLSDLHHAIPTQITAAEVSELTDEQIIFAYWLGWANGTIARA